MTPALSRRLGLALLLTAALSGTACEAFDESLLDGGTRDAQASCPLARPPARPTAEGDDGTAYFYAARNLFIAQGEGDAWASLGFDLDNRCTQSEESLEVECYAPAPSAPSEIDGIGGRDNSLGHNVLPIFTLSMTTLQDELRQYQTDGTGVPLIQIRGWNGQADDNRVEAVLALSVFATPYELDHVDSFYVVGGIRYINDEVADLPRWEGKDWWYARDDNFLGGDPETPRTRDDNAYIAGNTLVMRLPDRFPIIFGGDMRAVVILLTDATFTMQISEDRQTIETATLSGRYPVLDIIATLDSMGVCPGTDDYDRVTRLLDFAADIRELPGSGGPDQECDAVSVAFEFQQGSRANFAGVYEGFGVPEACSDVDGGVPDGGPSDGGPPRVDGGPPVVDGGPMKLDGGVADGGMDGGP